MLTENHNLLDLNEEIPLPGESSIKKSSLVDLYQKWIANPIKDLLTKSEEIKLYSDTLVFNNNHELLFLKRVYGDGFEPGKWGLPGGNNEGEDPQETAGRECAEETGLVLPSEYLTTIDVPGARISYYVAVHSDLTPILLDTEEHLNYAWVKIDELDGYELITGLRENLKVLLEMIEFELPKVTEEKIPTYESVLAEFEDLNKSFDAEEIDLDEFHSKRDSLSAVIRQLKKEELAEKFNNDEIDEDYFLQEFTSINQGDIVTLSLPLEGRCIESDNIASFQNQA